MKEKLIAWLLLLAMLASYIVLYLQPVAAADVVFDDLEGFQAYSDRAGDYSDPLEYIKLFGNSALYNRVAALMNEYEYWYLAGTTLDGYQSGMLFSHTPVYMDNVVTLSDSLRYYSILMPSSCDFQFTEILIKPNSLYTNNKKDYTWEENKVVSPNGRGSVDYGDITYNRYQRYYNNAWQNNYILNFNMYSWSYRAEHHNNMFMLTNADVINPQTGNRVFAANCNWQRTSDYTQAFVNQLGIDYLKLSNIPGYDYTDDTVTISFTDAAGVQRVVALSDFKSDTSEYGLLNVYIPVSDICADSSFTVTSTKYAFGSTTYACYDTVRYRRDDSSGDDGVNDVPTDNPGSDHHSDLSSYIGSEARCTEDLDTGILYGLSVPAWASIYAFYDTPTWDELADAAAVYDIIVTNYVPVEGKDPEFSSSSTIPGASSSGRQVCPVFFTQRFYQRQICFNLTDGINFLGNYLYKISQQNSLMYKLLYNQFSSIITKFNLLAGKLDKLITILDDIDSQSLDSVLTWLSSIDAKLDKLDNLQPGSSLDSNALDDLMQLLQDIKNDLDAIKGLLRDVITAINNLNIDITQNITEAEKQSLLSWIGDILKMIIEKVLDLCTSFIEFLLDIISEIFGAFTDLTGNFESFFSSLGDKESSHLSLFGEENAPLMAEVSSYFAIISACFTLLPAPITAAFVFGFFTLVVLWIIREVKS